MKNDSIDNKIRLLGYGILFAITTGLILFATRILSPSFEQLPRHVQDQFRDTGREVEAFRRNTRHALFNIILLTTAGVGIASLVQRNTARRIRRESNTNVDHISGSR